MSCGCSLGVTGFEEKARWWSCRRRQLGRQAAGADEALRSVVAVYSGVWEWEARCTGGVGLRVDLDLFERSGASFARAIAERAEEMAALLGARSIFLG